VEPVSLLAIHGTADPEVPLAGGRSQVAQESISYAPFKDDINTWRALDGCSQQQARTAQGRITTTTWTRCSAGSVVEQQLIAGGVHTWPGTTVGVLLGVATEGVKTVPPSTALNASQDIADFFAIHHR
jgi:polyhydroxybutyrate depolymerase